MKNQKIFCINSGLQGVQQAIERGAAAIAITEDEAPADVCAGAYMFTHIRDSRPENIAEYLTFQWY